MLSGFLDQQQIYAGHSIRLGADSVNSHALIPANYINGQVILLLHFGGLRDRLVGGGGGALIYSTLRSSLMGYFDFGHRPGFDTRSGNILSFLLPLFQEGQLSVTGESMCTKYWLTA